MKQADGGHVLPCSSASALGRSRGESPAGPVSLFWYTPITGKENVRELWGVFLDRAFFYYHYQNVFVP